MLRIMNSLLNDLDQFFQLLRKETFFDRRDVNPYEKIRSFQLFGCKKYIEEGLSLEEARLYAHFENNPGKALVIGCSAGRECVYLSRKGWKVVGFDFVKGLVDIGQIFAQRMGLDIDYHVLSVHDLDENTFPREKFDFVAFSIFALVLTRKRREKILTTLRYYLKDKGKIAVIFQARRVELRMKSCFLKRFLRLLKPSYEEGDYFGAQTFLHVFTEGELKEEVEASGFAVKDLGIGPIYKWALIEKV